MHRRFGAPSARRVAAMAARRAQWMQGPGEVLLNVKVRPLTVASASSKSTPPTPQTTPSDSLLPQLKHSGATMTRFPGGVVFIYFNTPQSPVNIMTQAFFEEVPPLIEKLEADQATKTIVFMSKKEGNFMAGVDITTIRGLASQGRDVMKNQGVRVLHNFFQKLENGKPKIAAISGSCIGGGLEMSLACHFRIVSDSTSTFLALPEVNLGLLPGGGGCQRLPKLVGVQNALPMLITGAPKKSRQAASIGLVDAICPAIQLEACALKYAQDIGSGALTIKRPPPKGLGSYIEWGIRENNFVSDYVFAQVRAQVMQRSRGLYPAPLRILDLVKATVATKTLATERGYEQEADAFADLAVTPESEGLTAVFFGQAALRKNPFPNPRPVGTVAVLGAGLMGAGIAEVSVAAGGYRTLLKDVGLPALQRGERQIEAHLERKVARRAMTGFDKNVTMSRLVPLADDMPYWGQHFRKADLVIEAVFENLELKHRVIKEVEEHVPATCIIATNTSSLPVRDIARASKRPENVVGMHYFSPADKMKLLEVIPHEGTCPEAVATAVQVGLRQGKIPVVCKDVPGFFVNRCTSPFNDECLVLAYEVDSLLDLDRAVQALGFPVGPMTLADEVGLEVVFKVHLNLRGDPLMKPRTSAASADAMKALLDAGIKGKRFGNGLLSYPAKKQKGPLAAAQSLLFKKEGVMVNPAAAEVMKPFLRPTKPTAEEIQQRVMARFLNEAVHCLQDGVIRNVDDGDMAAVFGIGFPAFTGGPFRHLDRVGVAKYADTMSRLADKHGPRFAPAPLLVDMAKAGKRFRA